MIIHENVALLYCCVYKHPSRQLEELDHCIERPGKLGAIAHLDDILCFAFYGWRYPLALDCVNI